ncbi:MAG: zinc ABC transporter solute-binding protein [Lentisphaerae bacterium]|jgi:zinc transport system substrate-binding protein|nr:zinc ABC transporter solute-binding protein [Lentisphaerota bacterium]
MKIKSVRLPTIALALCSMLVIQGFCYAKHTVAVAVPPMKFLIQEIGGDDWNCIVLADKGQDPHIFEPSPKLMEQLKECDLFFKGELKFEEVLLKKLAKINPEMKVVPLEKKPATKKHLAGRSYTDHDDSIDPHGWMSLITLSRYAQIISREFALLDSANSETYKKRADAFYEKSQKMQAEYLARLKEAEITAIAVYHPAWGHFAKEFNLKQIAIEAHGLEPGPRHLHNVNIELKKHNVSKIFAQNKAEASRVSEIAKTHQIETVIISPLFENPVATIKATVDALCDTDKSENK